MECDNCHGNFEPDQVLRDVVEIKRDSPNVESYKSMGLEPLLDSSPPYVVSCSLCEKCFRAAYKKFTMKALTILSIIFLFVDLFLVSLILFGKWDSENQRNVAGAIGLVIINGGMALIWILSLRRCKRLTPTPADRSAVFGPHRLKKLRSLSQQVAEGSGPSSLMNAEEAVGLQAEMFRELGFTVGGLEAAKEAARKAAAARPDEPWFEEAVAGIVFIYRRHPQGFVQGFGGAPEQELRRLGEMLNEKGGMDLMRAAHAEFSARCEIRGAARNLEFVWDGIGRWQG